MIGMAKLALYHLFHHLAPINLIRGTRALGIAKLALYLLLSL
jgi:hypothetical protein